MSEVGLLFPPYQQRSRLQSNTYKAITHLFTLFDQHKHSLNNKLVSPEDTKPKEDDMIEPNKKDSDSDEEGQISGAEEEESVDAESEEGEISDSGDADEDKGAIEEESGERNLEQEQKNLEEAKKRCTGTYEKFMLSLLSPGAGRVLPENAVAKTSSSASSMNSVVQAEASGAKKEKRKRGAMTQGRKEKWRAKRRKQRAEQDKQNGVKRLKLEIVTKPKTVNYCKYYLEGKCQRGDACKFSHDTIPLTKSKACHHHARGNCLKGDECPYDHDLFKYPCDNYKNKGFCGRGDSCLFSHKIAVVDDKASQVTSDVNVNGIGGQEISSLGKEQNKGSTSLQMLNRSKNRSLKTPGKLESNVRQPTPPTQTPQGICSLLLPSAPSADSTNQLKRKLPVARGYDTVICNVNNGAVEKLLNGNEILGRKPTAPPQPPKGINFLTFPSTLSTNTNNQQNRHLPVAAVNGGAVGRVSKGVPELNQNTNEILGRKSTPPAQPPKGITFLSFQKTLSKMQNSEVPVAKENGASKKFQDTNDSGKKPPLTFPSSQTKMVAEEQDKNTSNPWTSKASCSTSWSTHDSKLTNPSIQPPPSNGNIPTVSSILQEFLLNGQ